MRRGKKAAIPVSSVAPALRRRASSSEDPEAPFASSAAASCSLGSSASQGDPLLLPESKGTPGWAKEPRLPGVDSASSPVQPETSEPPLPRERVYDGCGAQDVALQAGIMLGVFRSIPTQMDYKGQKLAEQIFQGIILFSAVIGFIYGYITEQFGWTVYIVMAGFALSCLLTLPPWPIYRRNPLKWLPVQESAIDEKKPADRKVKRHTKN
ncbi:signal peptidase complex subunit 1 [Lacerta agilis]|uniref:signal peptidase complex subunit 1 n=1 Tax=Lacerta agilis TaxID=80427 RepID=UPI0014191165|nr:signal peptidase complex subunit 1 [Lacerta agilis]